MQFNNIIGTFNRTSKLTLSGIEELIHLLESSDYNNKIHSNGFSEYLIFIKHSTNFSYHCKYFVF